MTSFVQAPGTDPDEKYFILYAFFAYDLFTFELPLKNR